MASPLSGRQWWPHDSPIMVAVLGAAFMPAR